MVAMSASGRPSSLRAGRDLLDQIGVARGEPTVGQPQIVLEADLDVAAEPGRGQHAGALGSARTRRPPRALGIVRLEVGQAGRAA